MDDFICVKDFERYAAQHLPKNAFDYYRSGADDEITLRENCAAFRRLKLRPSHLRGNSTVDTSTEILGNRVSYPICIAPTAMHKMAHPDGEIATAKAAASVGTCMTLSSWSTSTIEDVAAASAGNLLWFQLYIYRDKDVTLDLVQRAEKEGYKAIVWTVDTPVLGCRRNDVRNKFVLPSHLRLENYARKDEYLSSGAKRVKDSGLASYVASLIDSSLSWDHFHWLRSVTTLPILVKGTLTAEDAIEAVQNGVDGIVVSNHGARQLDGVPATIEALPEVVNAVDGKCEVFLDGGIRNGSDALKALALGAKAVFIGRPILYGLAYNGEDGVRKVLNILKSEFERAMFLSGCGSVKDIKRSLVVHESHYSRL